MKIMRIGIDLARKVFQPHSVDQLEPIPGCSAKRAGLVGHH
jgi:hypothetical protein